MSTNDIDFSAWLDGLPVVEEDHIFTPIGKQTAEMTRLLNERAALLEQPADVDEGTIAEPERSLGESYTERRDELDEQIHAQLEADHPDAPRIRLRGLSDEDFTDVAAEVEKLNEDRKAVSKDGKTGMSRDEVVVQANLRYIARAAVSPTLTVEDVALLRKRLNQGEWGRLVDHVNRLSHAEAEAVDFPN